jgi:hypothetical protein
MTDIQIPSRAVTRIAAKAQARALAEQALAETIADIRAALDAPDEAQVQVQPDGSMAFVVAASAEPASV